MNILSRFMKEVDDISPAELWVPTADDLFGGPQGSPRTDNLIAASIQRAERIMTRIDDVFGK
jgi:hypothetical protein